MKQTQGTFYGVSVGPGDPEHMTLKAVKILEKVRVIATPQTMEGNTLAFDIARQVVDMTDKDVIPLTFLMTRDREKMEQRHQEITQELLQRLRSGEDVAMLNLGDVSVYSTFSYVCQRLKAEGVSVEVVPGVTSFCAVASVLQTSLTTMSQPLHILPAGSIENILPLTGTKVVMKTGKAMGELKTFLQEHGQAYQVQGVENCGLPEERVFHSLEDVDLQSSYFTTLIIKKREESK